MNLALPPGDFRAFIFDCDGTLADTMPLHYQAWRAVLDPLGCAFPEELFYSLGGMPARAIVELLNVRNGLPLPPDEIAQVKEEAFIALVPQVQPIAPVVAVAREVRERGFPVAVASGGFRRVVLQTLDVLGLREWFPVVVTSEDVIHGKPAPDTYLEAARRLGVDPAVCVVFEDTQLGLDAAAAAGMGSVFVPSGPVASARRAPPLTPAAVGCA